MATCILDAGMKRPEAPACRNALVSVRYTLVHRVNGDNNIVAAFVDLAIKTAMRTAYFCNLVLVGTH